MKEIQIILSGGIIIIAVYTGQLLFTEKVTIHNVQNVSITNDKGERISNAGSAADVAANYPDLAEEVTKSAEAYVEEKIAEEIAKEEEKEEEVSVPE